MDYTDNRRVLRGYVARNTIDIRVDAVDRIGELLEMVVTAGATSVGGVRFDLKDRGKLEREALRLAVSDARERAVAAAAGAGRSFDRILRIEEQGESHRLRGPFARRSRSKDPRAADEPVRSRSRRTSR